MCGILAQINAEGPVDRDLFISMRDTMTHRGPDGAGIWQSGKGTEMLGHRRLSIIDLTDDGKQPMTNEDRTIWLSFNGEIYNFLELRRQLEACGHKFASRTDSEVIVHAYEEWGENCVDRLWGMFAFVIWDERRRQLFGARDRLGVKPLHYYHSDRHFICASEIKAIVEHPSVPRDLDTSAIGDYLTYRYIPAPKTIWKAVRKIPPATAFTYRDGAFHQWRYWKLTPGETQLSVNDATDALDGILDDAVKRRLVSDVPLGVFLSGGLDSTAITYLMHREQIPTKSFTIGFEGDVSDETHDAETVARHFGTDHQVDIMTPEHLADLSELTWYFDEPLGASSIFPTYLVSRSARQHVTVALSGDGGDEALAGYNWYDRLLNIVPEGAGYGRRIKEMTRGAWSGRQRLVERYRQTTTPRFTRPDVLSVLEGSKADLEEDELWFFEQSLNTDLKGVKALQWLDIQTFLPEEVLTKVDRASMANSLEVRSPFMDHRLFEWVFSLDESVYFDGQKKRLLKQLLRDRVPDTILKKKKQGFSAPVSLHWDHARCNDLLKSSAAVKDGLFNPDTLESIIRPGSSGAYAKSWLLTVFDLWYQRWC